ncbi:microfibril-associated glycoprotein 4-like [Drosophila nasuta]|uniref:microfibril-associated glycoprotein 4-like n=1 Tax=Drosophila nasuta TaxID=42062 RepID=UPI00295E586C|nr:microfibril-associated glycoprotein 4-like [Drosophila nasuta]
MRYELYIHMEKYDGTTRFAHYDHFIIEGRDQDYKLSSLGNYLENDGKGDYFRYHKGMKFYTFDRDRSDGCAKDFRGGWWFFGCAGCFLNGVYSETDNGDKLSNNFWSEYGNLKRTQMLIRKYQE